MNNEEIISGLKFTIEMFLLNPSTGETYTEPRNDMDKITIDACRGAIELLKQEPKIGRWIDFGGLDGALWHICSECGETEFYASNYCPNCGAKMEETEK